MMASPTFPDAQSVVSNAPHAAGRFRAHSRLPLILIVFCLLCLLGACSLRLTFQTFQVTGVAMQPALSPDQVVLVNMLAYLLSGPARGDVIVFHNPADPSEDFIKRVLALPGDTVQMTAEAVLVDGIRLKEPYITQSLNPRLFTLTLQPGHYFVAGDNRPYSSDSRSWGPVPAQDILGKALLICWPLDGWRAIPTYPEVFAGLPTP
jgi:signal peptidase I